MWQTKRTAMTLALGMLLVLFSTACVAAPAQASMSHTASAPPPAKQLHQQPSQQLQAGWNGWFEVPGNGFTLSGPALTFDQGNDYVFVRGTNNHLYVNASNGTTWSGWSEVPGHGLTPSAPAATTLGFNVGNDTLYLFVRGTDNKIYVNPFVNGMTWSGWSQVPGNGLTPDAPGATAGTTSASAGWVALSVRGTNDRIYVNVLNVGQ